MNKSEYIPLSLASSSLTPISSTSISNRNSLRNFSKLSSHPLSRSTSNSSSVRSISPTPTELDNDDHERRGFLPSYNNGRGRNVALLSSSGRIWSRVRGGRIRWLALLSLVALVLLFWLTGKGGVVEKVRENGLKSESTSSLPPIQETISEDDVSTTTPKSDTSASNTVGSALSMITDNFPIDINVQPLSLSEPKLPLLPDEKFLAYTPHSGYHNQRISLENALTLSYMLNRTLLLPPLWLGHAIPYIAFDKLQRRVQIATKFGLERCKLLGEGGSEDVIPRECEGYFDWTIVGWEFLVNLSGVKEKVKIRNRWNMTREWLEEELELSTLKPPSVEGAIELRENDTFYVKDSFMYQYRFYDSEEDLEPLAKFAQRWNIGKMKENKSRLIHFGSLFGTSRLRTTEELNFDARSFFRKSMVFENTVVDEIVDEIKQRLGGSGNYYGLHLRVGDGIFQHEAKKNMAAIWQQLCVGKMKLDQSICDRVRSSKNMRKRDLVDVGNITRRASNSRPQREGAYNHAPLPPLPTIFDRSSSLLHPTLSCRSSFHSTPEFLPFNTPLFIATDSKLPSSDPNLSIFFDTFPCTFILNDFNSVSNVNSEALAGLGRLSRLRNSEDFVPLAQFLYPQLDAQIASHGRGLVGTPQSTYSRFAVDVLHQVYHGWQIIERG